MTKKYTTKITYANSNKTTLRSSIPSQITSQLKLEDGDSLKWIVTDDGRICVEKLEL